MSLYQRQDIPDYADPPPQKGNGSKNKQCPHSAILSRQKPNKPQQNPTPKPPPTFVVFCSSKDVQSRFLLSSTAITTVFY